MSYESASSVTVELIMSRNVVAIERNATVRQAASLMEEKRRGCLIVVFGSQAIGIITERDIVHKVTSEGIDPSKVLVQDIMSTPLITVDRNATLLKVAEQMSEFNVRKIVVVDQTGKLIGLVTSGDLAKWLAAQENYANPTLNAMARIRRGSIANPYG